MATRNIALLGATYSAVPAVQLPISGGGTAKFTEVSDTTATASDVASGKVFYTADGSKATGTASGGGEYIRTVVCPQQTFSNAAGEAYAMLTNAQRLIDDDDYIITYDGVEYVCSCEELWGTDRFIGSISITWSNPSSDVIFPFCVEDWNNFDAPVVHAMDNLQHSIKIEHLELLTTGTVLVPKTITQNGTYDPADDDADGYSEVTINVPSGSPTLQAKTNVSPTESSQTITADSGFDGLSSVQINAISTTYVGSGVTRKAAATITPGTTNQTIAAETYLTGAQTIVGDANLVSGNILSGKTIFGVQGGVTFQTYYTGSTTPASSLGVNGDIYLMT